MALASFFHGYGRYEGAHAGHRHAAQNDDEPFGDIAQYLLSAPGVADPYMCLADFESYRQAHHEALSAYADPKVWNRMSLCNIAAAGHFAADRSIKEYADRIWKLRSLTGVK